MAGPRSFEGLQVQQGAEQHTAGGAAPRRAWLVQRIARQPAPYANRQAANVPLSYKASTTRARKAGWTATARGMLSCDT